MKLILPVFMMISLGAVAGSSLRAQQQPSQPPPAPGDQPTTTAPAATTGATGASTTNDGVFTDAQAKRGGEVYQMTCAACHDAQLTGSGTAPPLTGSDFAANWKDENVGSLFERIRATMPGDNPGSLTPAQSADLVAFILNFNKYPAGQAELAPDSDALKGIKIAPPK